MTTDPNVLVDVTNAVGTVTLNRPDKLNAFFGTMRDEIGDALEELAVRDDVRVVIITGKHTIMHYLIKPITRSFNVAFREE